MIKKVLLTVLMFMTLLGAEEVIQVVSGQQKPIEIGKPTDVLVGDSKIAILDHTTGTRAILIGRSPGFTSLTLRYRDGREETRTIHVVARDPKVVIEQLQALLSDIPGLKYRIAGNTPVVEGDITSDKDAVLFRSVLEQYPDILNMVKVKTPRPMIGVAVKDIEVNLSKTHEYKPFSDDAVGFSAEYKTDTHKEEKSIVVNLAANILPKIEYWLGNGTAQLVADPVLTALNREKASMQIGGEFPYEYNTQDGMAVEWKKYGVILDIVPELLPSDEILVDLAGEVSSIDAAHQTSKGVPGVSVRKVTTKVAVKNNETLVISGIKYKESSVYKKRVPVLGHLLPFLFYQRTAQVEDKELLILVTPTAPAKIDVADYGKLRNIRQR